MKWLLNMRDSWKNSAMHGIIRHGVMLLVLVMLGACSGSGSAGHAPVPVAYTCSMHPQIIRNKPGFCPICGMALVRALTHSDAELVSPDVQKLATHSNTAVVSSINVIHPQRTVAAGTRKAVGVVAYDTRKTYAVPARFDGRIEKLYVTAAYRYVTKGEALMDVYSPALVTAQRELRYAATTGSPQLVVAAKQKLMLFGLTSAQVDYIATTGHEIFALPIRSPYSGYVVASLQAESPSQQTGTRVANAMREPANVVMDEGGEAPSQPAAPAGQISLRAGMYIVAGQLLFNVVADDQLWVEFSFPVAQAQQIKVGDVIMLGGQDAALPVSSRVDFIQPFFSDGKPFIQVRSYLNNTKKQFHVGQIVTGQVMALQRESLWVPRHAVLDLGNSQIVFSKRDGVFTPASIKTGDVSDGWIEILSGLEPTSEIAANAHYLVDSESFIKPLNP